MRPALQRLLASPSALRVLSNCLESRDSLLGLGKKSSCLSCTYKSRRYGKLWSSIAALPPDEVGGASLRQLSTTQRHIQAEPSHLGLVEKVPSTEGNAPPQWRHRLETFEQFYYESDLDSTASQGPRLVDQADLGNDFELWLQLLAFRRRNYGGSGVATIWNAILRRDVDLPTTGPIADDLWNAFLGFAFQRRSLANTFYKYVQKLHGRTGRGWSKLYLKVLEHEIETISPHWNHWHQRLRNDFPPTFEHLQILFEKAMSSEKRLAVFKGIYLNLPIRSMYSTIVPLLCDEGMYKNALQWHNLLMRMGDRPYSSMVAEPLLHHLAIYGDQGELIAITKKMVEAGVSFAKPVDAPPKKHPIISREIMNRMHGEIHNIAPKTISDSFCARFFATKLIPVDMVISVLKVLGAEEIGPLSLREMAVREMYASAISRRIIQLQEAGIAIGSSRFSVTLKRLAEEEDQELVLSLLTSDQHPDELDNWRLQESLLAYYRRLNDKLQYRRTIAILTSNVPGWLVPQERWNLQLRGHATDRDTKAVMQTIEDMREARVKVSLKSSAYLRECLLSTRNPSKRPYRTDDIPLHVNIWQMILRDGGSLPPIAWREVLRRYGMAGRLDEFEKLALWLASWYSDREARGRQVNRTYRRHHDKLNLAIRMLESLPTRHDRHPLRVIFPPQAQEGIIAWGFRQCALPQGTPPHEHNKHAMSTYLEIWTTGWKWGLKLLLQLKQSGVHIQDATVASACRDRLLILFGDGISNRLVNRRIRANNPLTIEQMILGMEEVWGPTLFDCNKTLPPPNTLSRLQAIKESILGPPPLLPGPPPFAISPST